MLGAAVLSANGLKGFIDENARDGLLEVEGIVEKGRTGPPGPPSLSDRSAIADNAGMSGPRH